jgi:hypothetical protein
MTPETQKLLDSPPPREFCAPAECKTMTARLAAAESRALSAERQLEEARRLLQIVAPRGKKTRAFLNRKGEATSAKNAQVQNAAPPAQTHTGGK